MPPAPAPALIAFAGHMADKPNRPTPRLPPAAEPAVARAIRQQLDHLNAQVGVSSLACGADILFAEALLARGGRLHVILPVSEQAFLPKSVRLGTPDQAAGWEQRYHAIMHDSRRDGRVHLTGDAYLEGSGTPFLMAALQIHGFAALLAQERQLSTRALVVWDGEAGDGLGGTASFVGHCVSRGQHVTSIHPLTGAVTEPGAESLAKAAAHGWHSLGPSAGNLEHRLVAVLFADAKGFSALTEPSVPAFMQAANGLIAAALARCGAQPLALNTWGDGLFVVMERPEHAARLALFMQSGAAALDPKALGLPSGITFRVGLHAAPAFVGSDPLTGRPNAYGADINKAARIEPIVEKGEVWASWSFATLAAATGCEGLAFECLGPKALAKGAGEMVVYRVKHKDAPL